MAQTADQPPPQAAPEGILLDALKKLVSDNAALPFAVSGAIFGVAPQGRDASIVCLGADAHGYPVQSDSLYPIGSTSKLATGLLLLQLIDAKELRLDMTLAELLPEARAAKSPGITLRHMLSHTSGLPLEVAHELSEPPGTLRYCEGLQWPGKLAQACLATEPVCPPGVQLRYSNLAYGLLGLIAARVCNAPFPELLKRYVFDPLQIEAYCGEVPSTRTVAIGDIDTPYRGDMEPGNSAMWMRMGTPWAGIITTPAGLLAMICAYREDGPLLSPELARLARSDQTGGIGGGFASTEAFLGFHPSRSIVWPRCPWGLAIEIQGGKRPHWGPLKLPESFGQIGSSGCLAWCDPETGTAWAIMGPRTTDSGWLLLHGSKIAQAALTFAAVASA